MLIGYARVSADEQNLAPQLDALHGAGCAEIFQDTGSGADGGRKGLADAVARCAAGDVLITWRLDRLGRSTLNLVGLETLKKKGVGLKVPSAEWGGRSSGQSGQGENSSRHKDLENGPKQAVWESAMNEVVARG